MPEVFIRTPYNYDTDEVSVETGLSCPEPTLTKQEFAEQCDPNFVIQQHLRGIDIPASALQPFYGDFTGVPDYHTALNIVTEAKASFDALDARIRSRFDNDPGKFLAFVNDPANEQSLIEMGFALPRESEPSPTPAPQPSGGGE